MTTVETLQPEDYQALLARAAARAVERRRAAPPNVTPLYSEALDRDFARAQYHYGYVKRYMRARAFCYGRFVGTIAEMSTLPEQGEPQP